jgi:DNA repair ATPase RecN
MLTKAIQMTRHFKIIFTILPNKVPEIGFVRLVSDSPRLGDTLTIQEKVYEVVRINGPLDPDDDGRIQFYCELLSREQAYSAGEIKDAQDLLKRIRTEIDDLKLNLVSVKGEMPSSETVENLDHLSDRIADTMRESASKIEELASIVTQYRSTINDIETFNRVSHSFEKRLINFERIADDIVNQLRDERQRVNMKRANRLALVAVLASLVSVGVSIYQLGSLIGWF